MLCELMCSLNPSLTQVILTKFAGEPPWQFPRGQCNVDLYNLNSIEFILIDFAVHVNFTRSKSNKFRRTLQEIDIKRGHVYFNLRLELILFRRILQEIDICIFNHRFELNVFHQILQETDMKQGHVYFQSVVWIGCILTVSGL